MPQQSSAGFGASARQQPRVEMGGLVVVQKKLRRCYKCGETKPLRSFTPDKTKWLGRSYRCTACKEIGRRKSDSYRAKQRRHIARYPDRQKSREVVRQALRNGELVRPTHCTLCPSNEKLHAQGRMVASSPHP